MKSFHYIFIFILLSTIISSCVKDDVNDEPGQNNKKELSVTGKASDISSLSAVLSGYANLSGDSGNDIKIGIVYSEDATPTVETAITKTANGLNSDNLYTVMVAGLKPNTTYYYASFVYQNSIYRYGKVLSFTTNNDIAVTTSNAIDVSPFSATLIGSLSLDKSYYSSAKCGFYYSFTSNSPMPSDGSSQQLSSSLDKTGETPYSFYSNISILKPGTPCYYRAFANIDGNIFLGETLSLSSDDKDFVKTGDVTNLQPFSASLSMTIDEELNKRSNKIAGVIISESAKEPLYSNTTNNSADFLQYDAEGIELIGLKPNTKYYYRAYVKDYSSNIEFYGNTESFSTPSNDLIISSSVPNTTPNSATVKVSVNLGSSKFGRVSYKVYIGESADESSMTCCASGDIGDKSFVAEQVINNLSSETKYYVRCDVNYSSNLTSESTHSIKGDISSFSTIKDDYVSILQTKTSPVSAYIDMKIKLYGVSSSKVSDYGIYYSSTNQNPSSSGSKVLKSSDTSKDDQLLFGYLLKNLDDNTTYYYKAYAKINGTYHYSEVSTFKTGSAESIIKLGDPQVEILHDRSHGDYYFNGVYTRIIYPISINLEEWAYESCYIYGTYSGTNTTTLKDSGTFSSSYLDADGTVLNSTTYKTLSANFICEDLAFGKTYYGTPVIYVDGKRYFGGVCSYSTDVATKGKLIDMGLSVKWASYDNEAPSPWESGVGYPVQSSGDIITTLWGAPYRTPTATEFSELETKCTKYIVSVDGRVNFMFIAKNGNILIMRSMYRCGRNYRYSFEGGSGHGASEDSGSNGQYRRSLRAVSE